MPSLTPVTEHDLSEIERLHVNDKKSIAHISRRFRCGPERIIKILSDRGVKIRLTFTRTKLNDDQLKEIARLYLEEKKSIAWLAKMFHCERHRVSDILIEIGVKVRPIDDNLREKRERVLDMYNGGASRHKISIELGLCKESIVKLLTEEKIPIRDDRSLGDQLDWIDVGRRYKEGESLVVLGRKFDVTPTAILYGLKKIGVVIRNFKESVDLKTAQIAAVKASKGFAHFDLVKFNGWRGAAEFRNMEWALTPFGIEEVYQRQQGRCYYTGLEMLYANNRSAMKKIVNSPLVMSLDRKDSSRGYTKDNVVLCCVFINYAKSDFDYDEFVELLARIGTTVPNSDATKAAREKHLMPEQTPIESRVTSQPIL